MMKKSTLNRMAGSKLQLNSEVLRRLTDEQLRVVAAGACQYASTTTTSYPTLADPNHPVAC